jgi:hypothetical protein
MFAVILQPIRKWAIWWITKVANQKFIHLVNYYYSFSHTAFHYCINSKVSRNHRHVILGAYGSVLLIDLPK